MDSEINQAVKNDFERYPYKEITDKDITNEGFNFFMRNNLPKSMEDQCFIYNLDDKNNGGTHWVCVCVQYPFIFYYDPYGTPLGGYPPQELRDFGIKNHFNSVVCNDKINQPVKSVLCGYFSLYMAKKLQPLIGNITEKKFDKLISNSFDSNPTISNVKTITKWSKNEGLL